MSLENGDLYPTRVSRGAQILKRKDPVVYGADSGPFSKDDVEAYERNGFAFLPAFYTPEEVEILKDELEQIRNSEEVRQSELAVTEPLSGEIRSVFAVPSVSELFEKLARDERLVGIITQLLGSDVYLHQSRVNFKPGFRGKEFFWHSDFETWHAEDGMPRMRAISCSIALTDNYEHNGPLMLIPGSHKHFLQCTGLTPENNYHQSLKKQDYGVPSDEQLSYLVRGRGISVPKGPAGSVVLFDCNTMHGSNGNITPYPRSNAFFVYNSVKNALVEPFAADEPRPWFLGSRDAEPLEPTDFRSDCLQPA